MQLASKTCEAFKNDHTCNQRVTGAESRPIEKTTSPPLISYKRKSASGSQTYHNGVVYSKKIDYVMVQGNMYFCTVNDIRVLHSLGKTRLICHYDTYRACALSLQLRVHLSLHWFARARPSNYHQSGSTG